MNVRRRVFVFSPFHFVSGSGELHGNGQVTRCPAQAASILEVLLVHAGEVVTREQMRAILWPEGEGLASDEAINKCISYLRYVLRDNSRVPQYIETLPKRGYRFVALVEESDPAGTGLAIAEEAALQAREPAFEPAPVPSPGLELLLPEMVPVGAPAGTGRLLWIVAVLLVSVFSVWAVVHYRAARHAGPAVSYLRIGVAPFDTTGAGPGDLAESFRLDIIDALAQVPQFRVSSSHVTPSNNQDRRAMLGLRADVLIFGTMSFDNQRARLHLELARGNDATHIASFRYEVALKNLIGLREQVREDLLAALKASRFREDAALGSTANPEAYATYLQARTYLRQWDSASWSRAEALFRQASILDPGFARAYAGLASTLIVMAEHGTVSQQQGYEEARRQAMHALALDPQLAEGHAALANIIYGHDWDFARAEQEYGQAIALDPGNARYHVWFASFLCNLGRFPESVREVNLAHSLDPAWRSPYLAAIFIYHSAGQPERSMEITRQLLALDPGYASAHDQLGWTFWYDERYAEAVTEWRTMARLDGDKDRLALEEQGAKVLALEGSPGYARLRLQAIESGKVWQRAENDFVSSEWFMFAGQRDPAIAALSNQVERHDPAALQIAVDPAYAPLRPDPRYQILLRRIGMRVPVTLGRHNWRGAWE